MVNEQGQNNCIISLVCPSGNRGRISRSLLCMLRCYCIVVDEAAFLLIVGLSAAINVYDDQSKSCFLLLFPLQHQKGTKKGTKKVINRGSKTTAAAEEEAE